MTFDEFKQHHEKFGSIDTPEKMEQVIQLYNNWKLAEEEKNYLEPISGTLEEKFSKEDWLNISAEYAPMDLDNGEICIFIRPSFEQPYQLKILSTQVVLQRYKKNVFKGFVLKTKTWPASEGEPLAKLVRHHISEAKTPTATLGTLDGVPYYFIVKEENNIKIGYKNDPDKESKLYEIIKAIEIFLK